MISKILNISGKTTDRKEEFPGGTREGGRLGSQRSRVTIRGTVHAALTILCWWLFVYWWRGVLPQTLRHDAEAALWLIGASVIGTAVLTLAWVRHNIGIFRRKGPRKTVPPVSESLACDVLGRRIEHPGVETLRRARRIVITPGSKAKRLEPEDTG